MARKSDSFYFDNYNSCADNICKAAHLLEGIMRDYNPAELEKHMDEMHEIEQSSDDLRHGMMDTLLKAFITPIEREDLARLSSSLDDVTDYIEGVLHRLYYDNIQELTPGALEMVTMLVKAAEEVRNMIAELPNFKKPESLHEHVISINTLESVGDEIFLRIMRELHPTPSASSACARSTPSSRAALTRASASPTASRASSCRTTRRCLDPPVRIGP